MQTYNETNSLTHKGKAYLRPLCALLLAGAAVFQTACTSQMFSSEPKKHINVKVTGVAVNSDVFLINGELDAGFKVTGTVQNSGDQSAFEVTTTLSCSEGEYVRKRTVMMGSGEMNTMQFDFPEPTINASDAKAIVRIRAID